MSYIHGYDPDTLREQVDPRECKDRLEEIGEQRSLPALLERVWLLKVLGRLEDALVLSEQSVRVARMAGTRKDLLRARILHASVMQFRGAYAAAEQELTSCAYEAEGQEWNGIAAFAYQHRGKVFYDAGRLRLGSGRLQAGAVPPPGVGRFRRPARIHPARDRCGRPAAHQRLGRQLIRRRVPVVGTF